VRTYLVGVSVYLLDPELKRILLLRRVRGSDFEGHRWEPVSGRAEPGEDLEGVARRETFEETHLRIEALVPFDTFLLERIANTFLHGVAFMALAKPAEVRLSPEHDASMWVSKDDLMAGRSPRLAVGVQDTVQVLLSRWDGLLQILGGA
jgi:8-oxo-dGTP pyrophosphatase MutT (NUDIX family)